jgi:hypothetical protein
MTKTPITFHYSINWQHPAPKPKVHKLIICVLLVGWYSTYTMLHLASDENAT